MTRVAGIDGTPGGWAVVTMEAERWTVRRISTVSDIFGPVDRFVAIDIPIGLLDSYEIGGRQCDRAARALLGRRASSVFPAPIRPTLMAKSWEEACTISVGSAPCGKAMSKQAYGILPKIKEVDELLQMRPELRRVVREVHPEICFRELAGQPMIHRKSTISGREERRSALRHLFPDLEAVELAGRVQRLPVEDILDAAVACWSALRIAMGRARCLPGSVPLDATALPMGMWV